MTYDEHDVVVFLLLAGMMYFVLDAKESILSTLVRMVDYNVLADYLDGTMRTGSSRPHADRWWAKTGAHLSHTVFASGFRCRCVTLPQARALFISIVCVAPNLSKF